MLPRWSPNRGEHEEQAAGFRQNQTVQFLKIIFLFRRELRLTCMSNASVAFREQSRSRVAQDMKWDQGQPPSEFWNGPDRALSFAITPLLSGLTSLGIIGITSKNRGRAPFSLSSKKNRRVCLTTDHGVSLRALDRSRCLLPGTE